MTTRTPPYRALSRGSVLLFAMLLSVPASAQKVKVQYDKSVDFNTFKTYRWVEDDAVPYPTMNAYLVAAIDHDIQAKGLKLDDSDNADLWIAYDAAVNSDLSVATIHNPGYVSQASGSHSVWSVPSTFGSAGRHIRKGSFVVELVDSRKKQLVWSATATGTLKEERSKLLEQLDRIVGQMFENFPPHK